VLGSPFKPRTKKTSVQFVKGLDIAIIVWIRHLLIILTKMAQLLAGKVQAAFSSQEEKSKYFGAAKL
jgi:hypothetical protein